MVGWLIDFWHRFQESATEQLQAYHDMSLAAGEPELQLLLEAEHGAEVDLRVSTALSADLSGAAAKLASFMPAATVAAGGPAAASSGTENKFFDDDDEAGAAAEPGAEDRGSSSLGVACVLPFLLEEAEASAGQSLQASAAAICGDAGHGVRWLLVGILPDAADPAGYGGPSVSSLHAAATGPLPVCSRDSLLCAALRSCRGYAVLSAATRLP